MGPRNRPLPSRLGVRSRATSSQNSSTWTRTATRPATLASTPTGRPPRSRRRSRRTICPRADPRPTPPAAPRPEEPFLDTPAPRPSLEPRTPGGAGLPACPAAGQCPQAARSRPAASEAGPHRGGRPDPGGGGGPPARRRDRLRRLAAAGPPADGQSRLVHAGPPRPAERFLDPRPRGGALGRHGRDLPAAGLRVRGLDLLPEGPGAGPVGGHSAAGDAQGEAGPSPRLPPPRQGFFAPVPLAPPGQALIVPGHRGLGWVEPIASKMDREETPPWPDPSSTCAATP